MMNRVLDETHAPTLRSWVATADDPAGDFPIQNLPFCQYVRDSRDQTALGVGIGDQILDLGRCAGAGWLPNWAADAVATGSLNALMGLGLAARSELRRRISGLLAAQPGPLHDRSDRESFLLPQAAVQLQVPGHVGDYTDFYASVFHATNVGSMFRPDNPLLPNYKHVPIGYHGRASSLIASGTPFRRPCGQLPPAQEGESPKFGPCQQLDYELEVGCLIAQGNPWGQPLPIASADSAIFGLCLVNDWSARDMQRWEYQPLGPFLAKSFATTVSPWVVTAEALQPFRTAAWQRAAGDPQPLPYLADPADRAGGGFAIDLEVWLQSATMRDRGLPPQRLTRGSFATMYWTFAQMIAHHTSNGCNLQPGDLLASGTVSGPERTSRGCLLELTWNGEFGKPVPGSQRTPLQLASGEQRTFLQDGDEIILRGSCQAEGYRRIGFGECRGRVLPAVPAAG